MITVQPRTYLSRDTTSDVRELVVTLPIWTRSETNMRGHWAKKAKRAREHRTIARLVLSGAVLRDGISPPCVVTLTRISPRALDDDNIRAALKAVRDGVADVFGIDDRDPRVSWQYDQRTGAARHHAVEVCIRKGAGPR